jgi:hypothetical protein
LIGGNLAHKKAGQGLVILARRKAIGFVYKNLRCDTKTHPAIVFVGFDGFVAVEDFTHQPLNTPDFA